MAGDGIIANGVTEILKRLSILVASEIALAWGVNDELQNLEQTLDMILDLLDDAEEKQVKSKTVGRWLEALKDIAYEADDILDKHAYEAIHQCVMTRKRDRVSTILSRYNPVMFNQTIARDIKNINKKLNNHTLLKTRLGLEMLELGRSSGPMDLVESRRLQTDSTVKSLRIIGRDKDKSNVMKMLLHNDSQNQDENVQVIPIVGMGGLGKTTLAQYIYNDNNVTNHFELKMWVYVSNDFDVKSLYIKIIESIIKEKYDEVSNIDVITCRLQQHLNGKKYLLVLDDVWNKKHEEWERLRSPLLVGDRGSKIIVTTRNYNVASVMGGGFYSYELKMLEEDESWSLFKERTFGHVSGVVGTPTLMAIGKELVQKCGGLPLAIIFLRNILQSKKENEWNAINENEIWGQSSYKDETRILPILKLSYDLLPSHLKQCFLSFFPLYSKNHMFYREHMITLWMAEGILLQPTGRNNTSMEEVGNEYFNTLLSNSFFQEVEKDELGQVLSFKMHNLVHDLAKYIASDRKYLFLAALENKDVISNVRHLGVINSDQRINFNKIMIDLHNKPKPKLRTLLVSDESIKKIEDNAFKGTRRLRVLDLSCAPNIEDIASSSLSKLRHLRYLDLSCTKIKNLPESVMKLFHLQTLRLSDCVNLKELPKGIKKLINLRHLLLPNDIKIPSEIGQLSSLRTLHPFNVGVNYRKGKEKTGGRRGSSSCGIEVLEGLNLLNGEMCISHLQNVTSETEAQRAELRRKENLKKIFLNWYYSDYVAREHECDYEGVLEALQPHPNLKRLAIHQYYGIKLSRWMGDPLRLPNLVILSLDNCTECEQLVGFGKLPSLKVLELWDMDEIKRLGEEFYDNSGGGVGSSSSSSSSNNTGETSAVLFPLLEKLVLSDMPLLEKWVNIPPPTSGVGYSCSCFPLLQKITINCCPNLTITPTYFPSLKELRLMMINESVAVPLIRTNLKSLEIIELVGISKFRLLPQRLLQDTNVRDLKIYDCLDFEGFDQNEEEERSQQQKEAEFRSTRHLVRLPNLKKDHNNNNNNNNNNKKQSSPVSNIRSFTSLMELHLRRLPALKFLPDIRCFTSLQYLCIEDCASFKPLPGDLTCLSSCLEQLKLVQILNVATVEDFVWQK